MATVSRAFLSLDISIIHAVRMTVLNLGLFRADRGAQNDTKVVSSPNAIVKSNC